jgi:hypothetical protein
MMANSDGWLIIYNGLGCDSAYMIWKGLKEGWFDPARTILLSAQIGDESDEVKEQNEQAIFPFIRAMGGLRTVQVARAGPKFSDGIVVLSDTSMPTICYTEGFWKLSDHLLLDGVVPQYDPATGHQCATNWKKFVCDSWIRSEFGDQPITVWLGFNADESKRVKKSDQYVSLHPERTVDYPLHKRKIGRDYLMRALEANFGRRFFRSACPFCPFSECSGNTSEIAIKHLAHPKAAAKALFLEFVAHCFNPKQWLYPKGSLYDRLVAQANFKALILFQEMLDTSTWGLYRVRRICNKRTPYRQTVLIASGSREAMTAQLETLATEQCITIEFENNVPYGYIERRGDTKPTCEEYLMVAPSVVREKWREGFVKEWVKRHRRQYAGLFKNGKATD